jgi:GAF domain-containing protein
MPYIRKANEFAALARELARQPSLEATLQAIVEYAATTIDGAEYAALTVKRGDQKYATVAATGDLAIQVDAIQYQTGEGPCLEALTQHHVFRTDELATDQRWPVFGRLATEATGVTSMMSHRLFIEEDNSLAALNMYSREKAAFANTDLSVLDELATHCAIALASAANRESNENLRQALETSRDIGAAMGILMATKLLTKEQAFDLLRIESQHSHRKLRDVALDVTETGVLPGMVDTPKR